MNTNDGADLYRVTKVEDGYAWNGQLKAFEISREVLEVGSPTGPEAGLPS